MNVKPIVLSAVVIIVLASVLMPVINDAMYERTEMNAYTGLESNVTPMSPVESVTGSIIGTTITIEGVDYSSGDNRCFIMGDTFYLYQRGSLTYYGTSVETTGFNSNGNPNVTFTLSDGVFHLVGTSWDEAVDLSIPYSWAYYADPDGMYLSIHELGTTQGDAIIPDVGAVKSVLGFSSFVSTDGDVATVAGGNKTATVSINTADTEEGRTLDLDSGTSGIKITIEGDSARNPNVVLIPRFVVTNQPTELAKYSGLFYAIPVIVIAALAMAAFSLRTRY